MMIRIPRSFAPPLALLTAVGFLLPGESSGQGRLVPPRNDGPPLLDFGSVTPAAGFQLNKSIMVSGSVTDDVGIREVLYRIHGSKKWREADLVETASDEDTRQTTGADFYFRLKLRAGGNTRVDIRVIDIRNQESEFLTRRFRYARSEDHIPEDQMASDFPELDESSIMLAAGLNLDKIITVSGEATTRDETASGARVQFRLHGTRTWRNAMLGEGEPLANDAGFTYPFFFRVKLSSSESTRVVVKVVDAEGRESDYFTRRFRYDKYKRSLIRAPATPVEPEPTQPIATFGTQSVPVSSGAGGSETAPPRRLKGERSYGVTTRPIVR